MLWPKANREKNNNEKRQTSTVEILDEDSGSCVVADLWPLNCLHTNKQQKKRVHNTAFTGDKEKMAAFHRHTDTTQWKMISVLHIYCILRKCRTYTWTLTPVRSWLQLLSSWALLLIDSVLPCGYVKRLIILRPANKMMMMMMMPRHLSEWILPLRCCQIIRVLQCCKGL